MSRPPTATAGSDFMDRLATGALAASGETDGGPLHACGLAVGWDLTAVGFGDGRHDPRRNGRRGGISGSRRCGGLIWLVIHGRLVLITPATTAPTGTVVGVEKSMQGKHGMVVVSFPPDHAWWERSGAEIEGFRPRLAGLSLAETLVLVNH